MAPLEPGERFRSAKSGESVTCCFSTDMRRTGTASASTVDAMDGKSGRANHPCGRLPPPLATRSPRGSTFFKGKRRKSTRISHYLLLLTANQNVIDLLRRVYSVNFESNLSLGCVHVALQSIARAALISLS